MAKDQTKVKIAQEARKRPQERKAPQVVVIDPESSAELSRAIIGGFRAALLEIGPMLARIAAADLVHTVEQPVTVLGRSILEGQIAQAMFDRQGVRA